MFIKKYLKWISTALVLIGILLTNLNIYPINISVSYTHLTLPTSVTV